MESASVSTSIASSEQSKSFKDFLRPNALNIFIPFILSVVYYIIYMLPIYLLKDYLEWRADEGIWTFLSPFLHALLSFIYPANSSIIVFLDSPIKQLITSLTVGFALLLLSALMYYAFSSQQAREYKLSWYIYLILFSLAIPPLIFIFKFISVYDGSNLVDYFLFIQTLFSVIVLFLIISALTWPYLAKRLKLRYIPLSGILLGLAVFINPLWYEFLFYGVDLISNFIYLYMVVAIVTFWVYLKRQDAIASLSSLKKSLVIVMFYTFLTSSSWLYNLTIYPYLTLVQGTMPLKDPISMIIFLRLSIVSLAAFVISIYAIVHLLTNSKMYWPILALAAVYILKGVSYILAVIRWPAKDAKGLHAFIHPDSIPTIYFLIGALVLIGAFVMLKKQGAYENWKKHHKLLPIILVLSIAYLAFAVHPVINYGRFLYHLAANLPVFIVLIYALSPWNLKQKSAPSRE